MAELGTWIFIINKGYGLGYISTPNHVEECDKIELWLVVDVWKRVGCSVVLLSR